MARFPARRLLLMVACISWLGAARELAAQPAPPAKEAPPTKADSADVETPATLARDIFDPKSAAKRRNAIEKLSAMPGGGEEVYVKAYAALIVDDAPEVRLAAIRALGRHGAATHREVVRPLLQNTRDQQVRVECFRALRAIHRRMYENDKKQPLVGDDLMLPKDQASVTVPIHSMGSHLWVEARIGDKPLRLWLDTGASLSVVSEKLAKELRLPRLGAADINATGGARNVDLCLAEAIQIGAAVALDRTVFVTDLSRMESFTGAPIDGIIGADVLTALPVTFDFPGRTVTFHQRKSFAPPAGVEAHRLRVMGGHLPCVSVKIEDQPEGWFVIDTGSTGELSLLRGKGIGDGEWAKRIGTRNAFSLGMGGYEKNTVVPIGQIQAMGRTWKSITLDVNDSPTAGHGHLGLDLLGDTHLTLDRAAEKCWLQTPDTAKSVEQWLADTGETVKRDPSGRTLLMRAAIDGRKDVVEALLAKGADVNAKDKMNGTALMAAAAHREPAIIRLLLAKGADPNVQYTWAGYTALVYAAERGDLDAVRALLEGGADAKHEITLGWTALTRAAEAGHVEIVKLLMDKGAPVGVNNNGDTPLGFAAMNGRIEIMKLLLAKKAEYDINQRNKTGFTALLSAAGSGHVDAVGLLLNGGASIDLPGVEGLTPLMVASLKDEADVVRLLLVRGANTTLRSNAGKTALDLAAARGNLDVVEALIRGGE